MELLTACLFQALDGRPEVLSAQLHEARGFRGQALAAQRIRDSVRLHPDFAKRMGPPTWAPPAEQRPSVEIQDPYSLRCAPQILGALQEAHWHVSDVVTRELNASTDNPLVFPETEAVIHGGNFYGQQIAMVSDYLRIGLIKVALLAERQIERLINWRISRGLPPMLAGGEPGLNSGFAGAQLLATSLAAEARLLGTPASIQTIATNANNQDVVSMGCHAARMTRTVLSHCWRILSIEALALAQAADLRGKNVMGSDYAKLHDLVRAVSPTLEGDRPLVEDIQRVTTLLKSVEAQEHLRLHA
jgi:histidine ammonia-lyase